MDYYMSSAAGYFLVPNMLLSAWRYDAAKDCFIPFDMPYYVPIGHGISERSFRADIHRIREENKKYREIAASLAKDRHRGQKDKAGKDYFEAHVSKVAELVEQMLQQDGVNRLFRTGQTVFAVLVKHIPRAFMESVLQIERPL